MNTLRPAQTIGLALAGVAAGLVLAGAAFLLGRALRPTTLQGAMVPPRPAVEALLLDAEGAVVTPGGVDGQLTLLTFVSVADGHPGMLREVVAALDMLPTAAAARVRALAVTVRPESETAADVAAFAGDYDMRLVGLSGAPADVALLADSYGVVVGEAAFTRLVVLIDGNGTVRALYPWGVAAASIAADIEFVLEQATQ